MITEWLTTLNPKPHTARNYLLAMQIYTDYLNKSPEELLTEAENESTLLMRRRHIKAYLIIFRKHLQDTRAPTTVKGYLTGVLSFYSLFDIELPKLPRLDRKSLTLEKNNKVPSKDDLREVLKVSDSLERALLLVGASSGLSANEICDLRISDLNYDADFITTLELTRGKTGVKFCTFLSPECTKAVLDYLDFRNREGKTKRCVQHEKQKVLSPEDHLFIKRHIPTSYSETYDDNERALDLEAFVKIYRGLSTKARKNTPVGTWNFIRSHTIRKFYNSTLYNAGCQAWFIEHTMGHQSDATREAYYRPDPEKLKEIYKAYLPYLTIEKSLDVSALPEFNKIVEDNKRLAAEVERVSVERIELQELKSEIDRLYMEMCGTEAGFKIGTKLVRKFHPNKLILLPEDENAENPDEM